MRKSVYTSFFTLLAFWIVASFAQAQQIVTEIKDGAKVYIRYNAGTADVPVYYYVNVGSISGTTLMMDYHGIEFTLSKQSGTDNYALHATVSNDGGNTSKDRFVLWQNNRFKCDKGKSETFTFEKIDDSSSSNPNQNLYWVKNSGTKWKPNGIGENLSRSNSSNNIKWEVVTKEQLVKEMAAATGTNPVDATFFISDRGFDINRDDTLKAKWTVVDVLKDTSKKLVETYTALNATIDPNKVFSVGETRITNYTHAWSKANPNEVQGKKSSINITTVTDDAEGMYKVQQTLTGLPAGKYRIVAQGVSDVADACYLFASDGYAELNKSAFKAYSGLGDDMAAYDLYIDDDDYKNSIEVDVYGGALTIGVKNESAIASKAYVDNFELYYLGSSSTVEYTPKAVANTQWTEVTSASTDVLANPQNYLFTIWNDQTTLVSLANGTDGLQGAGYKTMSLVGGVDAFDVNSKDYIWEIYKTSSDKYVFVNATSRENMLQTEGVDYYFRFNEETALNTSSAEATLTPYLNNTWVIKTPQGYLRRWRGSYADVAVDNNKGYFKLYAIPRMQYVVNDPIERLKETLNTVSGGDSDRSVDISLVALNPDAVGPNGDVAQIGWNVTGDVKTVSPVIGEDGRKSCFEFPASAEGGLSQTLSGMPAGVYSVTAHVLGGTGTVFIGDKEVSITGAGTFVAETELHSDDGEVTFGVNSSDALKVDYFTLTYSVPSYYVTDYYIRTNVGTNAAPEYMYIAGGTISTKTILAKHGTSFLGENGKYLDSWGTFTNVQFLKFKTNTYSAGGTVGYLGTDLSCNNASNNAMDVWLRPVTGSDAYNLYGDGKGYLYGTTLYNDLTYVGYEQAKKFELVSAQQLIKELAYATPDKPADATFFINDPNFSNGNTKKSSWKVVATSSGNSEDLVDGQIFDIVSGNIQEGSSLQNNNGAQIVNDGTNNKFVRAISWSANAGYKVQQTLAGLPNGWYRVYAQGLGTTNGTAGTDGVSLYLFANNGTKEESVAFDAYYTIKTDNPNTQVENWFKETNTTYKIYERYRKYVEIQVVNGSLVIGAKSGGRYNAASYFDNFELYYLGEKSKEEYDNRDYNYVPVPFDVAALSGNMVEVTSATDDAMVNPQKYFFTIWENSTTCLALANGTDGHQGADYKTMSSVSNPDLMNDLSCLWEFDKTAAGKFVLVNMSDREHMMQTEGVIKYFRYQNSTALNVARGSVTFESALYNNWAINTPQGYAHRELKSCADVTVDHSVGYYKIYAIPRAYYVMDLHRGKYNATKFTPKDVTMLLSNPDAVGTGEDMSGIPAWTTSRSKAFWTKEGTSDDFGAINGKSYFVYNHSKGTVGRMTQTISNLPKGRYILSVSTRGAKAGNLYLKSDVNNFTSNYSLADAENDIVEGLVNVGNAGTLTLGVTGSGKEAIRFDNFKLYYIGDENAVYAEPLKSGEKYYIRKNIGTESAPEYRYLETGGSTWGTAGVIGEHGMDYKFVSTGKKSVNGYTLYNLDSNVGLNPNHFIGAQDGSEMYNDKWTGISQWYFIPRGIGDEYPFQYAIVYDESNTTVTESQFVNYDSTKPATGSNLKLSPDIEYFEIVPLYQRIKEFEKATKENPIDATFLIKDPNFSKFNRRKSAWKLGSEVGDTLMFENNSTKTINGVSYTNAGGGNNGFNVMVGFGKVLEEIGSFDVYQTITDIPNGHYIISASGVTTYEDGLKMYVTNGSIVLDILPFPVNRSITSNGSANALFTDEATASTYRDSIAVDVYNNKLVIGFKGIGNDSYSFFDNVKMVFCGESEKIEMTEQTPVDFEPKAKGTPWIEVTAGSDPLINPDDYLFAIWADSERCLALGNGSAGHQGVNYKTMVYTLSSNPLEDVSQLWEFYKNGDNNFIIVNASVRDKMLQAEAGSSFFRFGESANQTFDQAVMSLKSGAFNNWRLRSEATGNGRELKCWDNSEVMMVRDINNNGYGDYYKIYAIKRVDYYNYLDIMYGGSIMTIADASLLIKNPGAFGEPQKELKGWTANDLAESAGESFVVRNAEKRKFSVADGKTYFEFISSNNDSITAKLYQDIHGLPHGNYLLKAVTTCSGANAKMFLEAFKIDAKGDTTSIETIGEELVAADENNLLQISIEVPEGASLRLGVDFSNYKHIKSDDDSEDEEEGNNESQISVKFDKFVLQYMGVNEVLPSKLDNGVYFVRTNLNRGTNKSPEYRYLDAGGNSWGTDPVLTKHGFSVVLSNEDKFDGIAYKRHLTDGNYSIKSSVFQTGRNANGTKSGYDCYFDGLHFDHDYEESDFKFTKVENGESEFEYTMYTNNPKDGNAGYIVKKDNNYNLEVKKNASSDAAAVWEIVTKTQRVKELQDATYDNPMDATFFITDPSFSRNNIGKESWVFNVNGTDNVLPRTLGDHTSDTNNKDYGNLNIAIGQNGAKDHYNNFDFNVIVKGKEGASNEDFKLSQKLSIGTLPAGVYRLSVHGYTNAPAGVYLYAENEEKKLGSMELHQMSSNFTNYTDHRYPAYWFTGTVLDNLNNKTLKTYYREDMYYTDVEINVSSNTLIIGVQGTLSANQYAVFDNFELYYLGEAAQDISKIEVDEDPNVIDEPKEIYLYNVDAGMYLNFDSSIPGQDSLAILKDAGMKFYLKPVTKIQEGKKVKVDDKYYIYTVRKFLTKAGNDTSVVKYLGGQHTSRLYNTVYVNYDKAAQWTVTLVDSANYMYEIKSSYSQPLEWTGDAKYYVYSGYPHDAKDKPCDKEPRGYRWSFYDPNQYAKDRLFTKIASNARSDGWRYVRSAIVNMRDLVGIDSIPGLYTAYSKLDASWVSPMTSKTTISQLVSELKQVMIDALATRGTTQKPVDVSFFIRNAGLGSDFGWSGTISQYNSYSNGNGNKFIPSVYQSFRLKSSNKLSQNIANSVPAGKYLLSVDVRTNKASNFQLKLSSENYGTALMDTLNCISGTSGQYDVFSTPFLELDNEDKLSILVYNSSGDFAVDNFKLYFGGNVRGKLKFNEDRSEVTMLGDWDDDKELYLKAKSILQENLGTLGAMHINKDNVILRKGVNVTDIGWQKGNSGDAEISNNILFYTDFAESDKALDNTSNAVEGSANVVRKGDDSKYYCDTLLITDNMTMHVPYSFHADTIGYSRTNPVRSGTLCLPFDLTKLPNGISKLCVPDVVDWEANPSYGKLLMTEYSSGMDDVVLPANTPVFYDGVYGKDVQIDFSEKDAIVYATSELTRPTADTASISLFGNYMMKYVVGKSGVEEYGEKNDDGLSADECYYLKKVNNVDGDCMLVRGKHWFNVGPFRAFVYRGKNDIHNEARPSSLYIDYGDLFNSVDELDNSESVIIGYYDVKGIRYDKPQKGLNIIMFSDGTRRKAYMK